MADQSTIIVSFAPKGDDDVLGAIKKVTRHVDDLKRIAKTPIDLDIVKGSMDPASFQRLVDTVNQAKEATKGLGKETAKAGQEAAKAAKEAQKFAESMANMGKGKTIDNSGLTAAAFSKGAGGISPNVQSSLSSLKKVNEEIGRIRQLASTPIELKIFKTSLPTADYEKLKESVLRARKEVEQMNKEIGAGKVKAQGLGESLGFVGRIIAAMAIRRLAHEVFTLADAFTNLQNKLKATVSEDSIGFISKELFRVAQESRTSIESITTAFSRTTRSVKALGKSQQEVIQFTSTLSKAIQLGGSTAVEAGNAMIQLSQGMGSGALRGDELRSVLEQLPIVAELIADKMGVPISALRTLGSQGKITTDVIFDAINSRTEEINQKMSKMSLTVKQAWVQLVNQATMSSEKLGGVMGALARGIQFVTEYFDTFAMILGSIVGGIVMGTLASQIIAITGALKGMAVALAAGTGGLSLVIPLVVGATAALIPLVSQMEIATDATATFGDVWSASMGLVNEDIKATDGIKTVTMQMEGLSASTEKWMIYLAKALDILALINPANYVEKLGDWAMDVKNKSNEDLIREVIDSTNLSVSNRETDRLLNEAKEILAEDMSFDVGKNTQGPPKAAKAKDPQGQTFAQLMEDLNRARDKTSLIDDKDQASIAGRVAAGWLDAVDKLEDKIANSLTPAQSKLIEKTIEEKVILEDMLKLREHIQKTMEDEQKAQVKQLIDGIQEQIDREKKNKELVKEMQEARAERELAMASTAGALDPNQAIFDQIKKLEEFKNFANSNAMEDWAKRAREEIDRLSIAIVTGGDHLADFQAQLAAIFGPGGTLIRGLADATANAIVMGQSLKDLGSAIREVLTSVQKQAISALLQLPMNMAMGALTSSLSGASASPFASGGTGGARSVSASEAASWGMSSGGYTGNAPTDAVTGFVHGQEYVLNADATRKIGRQNLDMMNKGMVPVAPTASAPAPTNITVNNNAPGVDVQTREISPGQIEIMIAKGIRDQAPRVVAGQINDPNSMISRGLQKNLESSRRRV